MADIQFGRQKVYTKVQEITSENVIEVLEDTLKTHNANVTDIEYLYAYYKGDQPILNRVKEIRPEINNKIVENRAYEIVNFKVGYLLGEPIQYINNGERDGISTEIGQLNDLMALCGKADLDRQLVEWIYICGIGQRLIIPNQETISETIIPMLEGREVDTDEDVCPFNLYTLDPRYAYVINHSGLGEVPMAGVYITKLVDENGDDVEIYTVWTATERFEITKGDEGYTITAQEANVIGYVPMIEYSFNSARLGVFEPVLPLLDAINTLESNRTDGVELVIQKLLVLYNCDIDDDAAKNLRDAGLIKLKSYGENKADIKEIGTELNQQQSQVYVDYLHQTVLDIVGMPNKNVSGTNDSNGIAVYMGNGYTASENCAKNDEIAISGQEKSKLVRIALRIMRDTIGTSLKTSEVGIHFNRRNYENCQSKVQMLIQLLGNDKVDPSDAWAISNLVSDSESACQRGLQYHEKVRQENAEMLQMNGTNNTSTEEVDEEVEEDVE